MLLHFQYKPLFSNAELPGWSLTFFYKRQKHKAIYHQNGRIEWMSHAPDSKDLPLLETQIHELMLYHVYEK